MRRTCVHPKLGFLNVALLTTSQYFFHSYCIHKRVSDSCIYQMVMKTTFLSHIDSNHSKHKYEGHYFVPATHAQHLNFFVIDIIISHEVLKVETDMALCLYTLYCCLYMQLCWTYLCNQVQQRCWVSARQPMRRPAAFLSDSTNSQDGRPMTPLQTDQSLPLLIKYQVTRVKINCFSLYTTWEKFVCLCCFPCFELS